MDNNKISNCIGYSLLYFFFILILGCIIAIPFILSNFTNYKINYNIFKYIGWFLLFIIIIYMIIIIIIIATSKSCEIKKKIASFLSFGLKNCINDSDCNIHQKCDSFICTDKNLQNNDCENNDDCVNDLWCNKNKCVPKKRIGEICCNDEMCLSQKCSDENKCINSNKNIGDINDPCKTSDDCMFNLWCNENKCNKKKNDGEKCNIDDVCISGKCSDDLYCLSKNDNKYYIPKNRGPCTNNDDCFPGLICDESVCKSTSNIFIEKKKCKK